MSRTYPFLIALSSVFLLSLTAYSQGVPELMYYKFDNAGSVQTNYASSPVGVNPTAVTGLPIMSNGQFGTAIGGNGGPSDVNAVDNGWATNLGAGAWTISMWLNNFPATVSTSYYFFGDAGSSFRCFTGGVAGNNVIMLRGTSVTDVTLSSVGSAPVVVHFVHEVTPANAIKVYRDGVLISTVAQAGQLNITGNGFKIGGYSTVSSLPVGCLMDEFRMYNRALSATEVANTWNISLGTIPLAVRIIDLRASAQVDGIRIHWEVACGDDVEQYIVERSGDGKEFSEIGIISKGSSEGKYEFMDKAYMETGSNSSRFYRLLLKEKNGKSEYSKVIRVKPDIYERAIAVYPNPFGEDIVITACADKAATASISIVDAQGRAVVEQKKSLQKGENRVKMEGLAKLAKGNYQLRVEVNDKVSTEVIIKQ